MPRYIDAEKLKEFDFNKMFGYEASYETCLGIEAVLMIAEKMPSADVQEVKHGKWIHTSWRKGDALEYKCSECKRCKIWKKKRAKLPNYCEKCGARMDGK